MSEKYILVEEAKDIIKIYQAVAKNDTEALVANELDIVINRIPTYTPAEIMAGQWVPVTERLPEEKISSLTRSPVYYPCVYRSKVNGKREVRYYPFTRGHFYHGPEAMDDHIEAWAEPMPLPQLPGGAQIGHEKGAQDD